MSEQWVNSKGVKFVGQTSAVPAPDFKAPTVIDYDELKTVEIVFANITPPTETANAAPQTVAISAHVKSASEDPLTRWDHEILFTVSNNSMCQLENSIAAPHSGSTSVVFPAGIKAGQVEVVKAISGGVSGTLKITVL